jgi:hypothetical protein
MAKKSTLKTYIKNTADDVFSIYTRLKHADERGYVKCVTCGKEMYWKNDGCHAGHYVTRKWYGTRFDEQNVHPQCTHCNTYCEGESARYSLYLVDTYGADILDELDRRSRKLRVWTRESLGEAVKEWRAETEKMFKVKG